MGIPDRLASALEGRYRLERELGVSGMATVYLAEDLTHDRRVTIKVLKPELAAVRGAERFVQEIETTAALSHPHILPLFDSGEAVGFLYDVMPSIDGETIRDRLNRERQFPVDDALRITTEVDDALDYAHRRGVIHRDIKPENNLLRDGRPKVMDFGIALVTDRVANVPGSVTWSSDDDLVFVGTAAGLHRVSVDGGESTLRFASDSMQLFGLSPLPDRQGVLFLACPPPCDRSSAYALRTGDTIPTRLAEQVDTAIHLPGGSFLVVEYPRAIGNGAPL